MSVRDRFVEFVQPGAARLSAMAGHYARSPEEREDLLQETILRAWRSFAASEDRPCSQAWLYTILRNVAAEWHRAGSRRINLVLVTHEELTDLSSVDLSDPFPAFAPASEAEFKEFLDDHIARAFAELDDNHREVLLLLVLGGLTYREIARVLDCPVGTVMSRMARARRALRERLAARTAARPQTREARP